MEDLEKALWADYVQNGEIINDLEVGSIEHKSFTEERDKLRQELIKIKQIEAEENMKSKQIEADNHNEKIKNVITISTFALSFIGSMVTVFKSFRFDQEATLTSTVGRKSVNDAVSKIFQIFKR